MSGYAEPNKKTRGLVIVIAVTSVLGLQQVFPAPLSGLPAVHNLIRLALCLAGGFICVRFLRGRPVPFGAFYAWILPQIIFVGVEVPEAAMIRTVEIINASLLPHLLLGIGYERSDGSVLTVQAVPLSIATLIATIQVFDHWDLHKEEAYTPSNPTAPNTRPASTEADEK